MADIRRFIVRAEVTALRTGLNLATRVTFPVPVFTHGEPMNKATVLNNIKKLLKDDDLKSNLPEVIFGEGLMGTTYYVDDSVSIIDYKEVDAEEFAFHLGEG